jgi:uncharacterized protein YdhG (YjbR/CyaY superfamily)
MRTANVKTRQQQPKDIDDYIAGFPAHVRQILEKIRATIKKAAPAAEETISYRMPTFTLHGNLVHFAAFTSHIGFFPPTKGDAALEERASRYAGPKRNLRFPLDEPIPYALIGKIVKLRVKQNLARAEAKRKKR